MASSETMTSAWNRKRLPVRLLWAGITGAIAGGLALVAWSVTRPDLPAGVTQSDYDVAIQQFSKTHRTPGNHADIVMLLGELAVADGRLDIARSCFQAIPSTDTTYGPSARLQEAQVALRLNLARDAEGNFREFLALASRRDDVNPSHAIVAHNWLAYILSVELRIEERKVVLVELHRRGAASVYHSKQLYLPHLLIWPSPVGRRKLEAFREQDASDRKLLVAWGRYLTAEGLPEEARSLLAPLHEQDPRNLQYAAALLEACYEQNDWKGFAVVYGPLPAYRDFEPWLLTRLRGQFALHQQNWTEAILQFERVLAVDPADPIAHASLAKSYAALGRVQERDRWLASSAALARMRVDLVSVTETDADAAAALAAQCSQAGLTEAAEVFERHAMRIARSLPQMSSASEGDSSAAP